LCINTATVDTQYAYSYSLNMEVHFPAGVHEKLTRLAAQQGRDSRMLVVEAVERMIDYDQWFTAEVDKGLAAADRGEFIEHDEVGALMEKRYPA
jgi:predicted transcriptional regulator